MPRTASTTKDYLAPDTDCIEVEKAGEGFVKGREGNSERKVITIIREDFNVVTGAFRSGADSQCV